MLRVLGGQPLNETSAGGWYRGRQRSSLRDYSTRGSPRRGTHPRGAMDTTDQPTMPQPTPDHQARLSPDAHLGRPAALEKHTHVSAVGSKIFERNLAAATRWPKVGVLRRSADRGRDAPEFYAPCRGARVQGCIPLGSTSRRATTSHVEPAGFCHHGLPVELAVEGTRVFRQEGDIEDL
jgi:hypothetical protein